MVDFRAKGLPIALLVLFNLLYFAAFVLNLSPLAIAANVLTTAIAAGGVVHLVKKQPQQADDVNEVYEIIPAETVSKHLQCVYLEVNRLCGTLRSLVLWLDPVKSINTMVVLYLVGVVLKLVPTYFVVYVLGWAAFGAVFLREVWERHVQKLVAPYITQASGIMYNLYYTIPRFSDVHKI